MFIFSHCPNFSLSLQWTRALETSLRSHKPIKWGARACDSDVPLLQRNGKNTFEWIHLRFLASFVACCLCSSVVDATRKHVLVAYSAQFDTTVWAPVIWTSEFDWSPHGMRNPLKQITAGRCGDVYVRTKGGPDVQLPGKMCETLLWGWKRCCLPFCCWSVNGCQCLSPSR